MCDICVIKILISRVENVYVFPCADHPWAAVCFQIGSVITDLLVLRSPIGVGCCPRLETLFLTLSAPQVSLPVVVMYRFFRAVQHIVLRFPILFMFPGDRGPQEQLPRLTESSQGDRGWSSSVSQDHQSLQSLLETFIQTWTKPQSSPNMRMQRQWMSPHHLSFWSPRLLEAF